MRGRRLRPCPRRWSEPLRCTSNKLCHLIPYSSNEQRKQQVSIFASIIRRFAGGLADILIASAVDFEGCMAKPATRTWHKARTFQDIAR